MTMQISRIQAREALEALGKAIPPKDEIMEFVSVGLENDLEIFRDEYFSVENGLLPNSEQGTFKIVEAYYGGGKTHYLKSVERHAHQHGFASAFIELSKDSCPLTNFELIYARIIETLTLPTTEIYDRAVGIEQVLRALTKPPAEESDTDSVTYTDTRMRKVHDLPFPSLRMALHKAALATASDDRDALDEYLIYLRSGKVSPNIRKRISLEPIDKKTGLLAIRSLAMWLRQMNIPGLVLIMDEGDRSLSLSNIKDGKIASNNLVEIINQTTNGWAGVMFLYSIPSWQDFERNFSQNQALIQRVRSVGFPSNPLATRIVLDERYTNQKTRIALCQEIGKKLTDLFQIAYNFEISEEVRHQYTEWTAIKILEQNEEVHFRRQFLQSFIGVLYKLRSGQQLNSSDIEAIVSNIPQT